MKIKVCLLLLLAAQPVILRAADTIDVQPLLDQVRSVGPQGAGHAQAAAAWNALSRADARQLPEILAGMDDANILAINWIRAAVDTIAERELKRGGRLPAAELEAFLADRRHAPRARRTAYEWLLRVEPAAEARLLPGFLDDPSLELRRDAVARLLSDAEKLASQAGQAAEASTVYRRALSAARDVDQIKQAADKLKETGEKVDLVSHFGFVTRWKLIGPFDNSQMAGFDVQYAPESEFRPDGRYDGKEGKVSWTDYQTQDEFGAVDLAQALGKHKGAAAYAYAEFISDREQPVDLRLGTPNANKIWLNGEFVTANEVYHLGNQIDQYIGTGKLREGTNTILVKICQNEQTEDWAQDWKFQLRICDRFGTAVLPRSQGVSDRALPTRKVR